MSLLETFAKNLRALRKRKKLSQREVAAKTGSSISYISMLERGQRSPPLETVDNFGRAFKIPPISLLR